MGHTPVNKTFKEQNSNEEGLSQFEMEIIYFSFATLGKIP